MPWQQITPMSQRKEFINLARREDANLSRLCRYFQVSRKTAYKWLARYCREGEAGLEDRSRRPRRSPGVTAPAGAGRGVLGGLQTILGGHQPL